jgi:hypothetical protein
MGTVHDDKQRHIIRAGITASARFVGMLPTPGRKAQHQPNEQMAASGPGR